MGKACGAVLSGRLRTLFFQSWLRIGVLVNPTVKLEKDQLRCYALYRGWHTNKPSYVGARGVCVCVLCTIGRFFVGVVKRAL